tara:strand:- start:7595 stop:9310 length:1716 start_codon:yes stop_codon:yes gene_type:complete
MKWNNKLKKKIINSLVFSQIKNFKIDFIIVYFTSLASSVSNAISAVSIIPLVYILTEESNKIEKIPFFVKFFEKINIDIKTEILVIVFCIFFILTSLLKAFNDFFIARLRKKIVQKYLKNCLNQFFSSDWHFFYHTKISKISSAIYKDLEIISGAVAAGIHVFSNLTVVLVLILVPFLISYKVTVIIFLSSLILIIPFLLVKKVFSNLGQKRSIESETFSNFFNNSLNLIKIIIVNFKEIKTIKEILDKYKVLQELYVRDKFYNSLSHEVLNILMILFVFIIFFSGNYFNLFISEIVALVYSLLRIVPYLSNLLVMNNSLVAAQPSFNNISNILSNTSDIGKNWGDKDFEFEKEIILENINYNYPNGKPVLNNINLKIKKNTIVCFFGSSGSGKSTLIDIIAGLNYPSSGTIYFDDTKINNFSRESFSKNIGYVDSNNDLFPMSIRENLKWTKIEVSENDLKNALKFSNSINFIEEMKDKIDTYVGDKGSFLSAGQKQRICLSRAIIKNPDILVLDEATSHLDEVIEKKVMESLIKSKNNYTIIMTSHNKKLLSYFDEAYEFSVNGLIKIK